MLPVKEARVQSLVRELGPMCHSEEFECRNCKKEPHAATRTQYSQINKYILKETQANNSTTSLSSELSD